MAKAYSVVPCSRCTAWSSSSSVARGMPLSVTSRSSMAPKAVRHISSQSKRVLSMSVTRTVMVGRVMARVPSIVNAFEHPGRAVMGQAAERAVGELHVPLIRAPAALQPPLARHAPRPRAGHDGAREPIGAEMHRPAAYETHLRRPRRTEPAEGEDPSLPRPSPPAGRRGNMGEGLGADIERLEAERVGAMRVRGHGHAEIARGPPPPDRRAGLGHAPPAPPGLARS